MSVQNTVAIRKAKEVLEEISNDEHERYIAELREKYIRDQKSIEAYGYDNGYDNGLKDGRREGIELNKIEIAQNMLKKKMLLEEIAEITGLSIEEIKKLKEKLQT